MAEENKTPEEDFNYDTNKSYNQLVYGRYVFMLKILGIVAAIFLFLYLLLTNIGKSLKVETHFLTKEEYLSLPEKKRAQFRDKVRLSLLTDALTYRKDTVFIVAPDDKYLMPTDRGLWRFPEERAIYGCKLHALELTVKRALLELQFPFIFTRVVRSDSVGAFKLDGTRYLHRTGVFELYISRSIQEAYRIVPAGETDSLKAVTIALPDSIVAAFDDLYAKNSSEYLFNKYLGQGETGPFRSIPYFDFLKLSDSAKKAYRRAFFALPEAEQKKQRNLDVPVSAEYGCYSVDEKPGAGMPTLSEGKIHESEITNLFTHLYNHASYSLVFPMAKVYNLNFTAIGPNANSLLLIALKSGRAPAMYKLERKDCPKVLKQGMFADITQFLEGWDQVRNFPKFPLAQTVYLGKNYGIPTDMLNTDCIMYRRDWLEEKGVVEWFQKKGWIHPADNRPYIPIHWTYEDFRVICKLITDSDPLKKRKGFEERPGPLMYLDAHNLFHFTTTFSSTLKPDRTGKNTWVFFRDNPLYLDGLKTVHDMYWFDKSIRTGVEISYSSISDDFKGGRIGIAYTTSKGVLQSSLTQKYTIFGPARPYSEIVGLTSIPGSDKFPNIMVGDCDLLGFNPFLPPEKLSLAVEWIKERYYGEFVRNTLNYNIQESKTLGTQSTLYRTALASTYSLDFSQLEVNPRTVFPANYVEFYDTLRAVQRYPAPPRYEDFGLQAPLERAIQDQMLIMFEQVIMDSLPNYQRIINATADYIDQAILAYRDVDADAKVRKFYDVMAEYYRVNVPAFYENVYKPRFEQFIKNW